MRNPQPFVRRLVRRPGGIAKVNAAKVQCDPAGHPFDDMNTARWVDSLGYCHRECRACRRDKGRRRVPVARGEAD